MTTFLVIAAMFLAMFALMSVGVMFKRKPISGSCGGLGAVGVEKACDCDNPCDEKKAKMQQEKEHIIHFKDESF